MLLFMTALVMYIFSICPCLPIHQYKAFCQASRYSLPLSSNQNPLKSRLLLSTSPQAKFHSCFIHLSKLPLDVIQQCTDWYSYMGFCTQDIPSIYQCQIHHFKVSVIWCVRYLNHLFPCLFASYSFIVVLVTQLWYNLAAIYSKHVFLSMLIIFYKW